LKYKLPSGKSAFVTARVHAQLAQKLKAKGVTVTVPSGGLFQQSRAKVYVEKDTKGGYRWVAELPGS
jgi:hypothetical protein